MSLSENTAEPAAAAPQVAVKTSMPEAAGDRFTFNSQGTEIVGYHFAPKSDKKAPVVILAHGLGGLQTSRIQPFAQRFADEGYHAITFDYRSWGESAGTPRNIINAQQQHDDYRAAIEAVKALPGVDGDRIVLWGSSLSGGHVLSLGSKLPELSGVIAQCPHVNGIATTMALPLVSLPGLFAAWIADVVASAVGRQPVYIPLGNKKGKLGALTQAGAYEGYEFVQPTAPAPGNVFAARFALALPFYSPDGLKDIKAPTFIAIGKTDNVTPSAPAIKLAKRIKAELHEYDGGHFSVYYGAEQYETNLSDQVAFLKKNVPL